MHDWKSKIERKKRRQSQTPGRIKTLACQATSLERFLAKHERSYKHPAYNKWVKYMKVGGGKVLI